MREVIGFLLVIAAVGILIHGLLTKWPPAKVKYDEYYKGYYISGPGILNRQVHYSGGDFYYATGGFDKNHVWSKDIADRLLIEYKRWLKAGH